MENTINTTPTRYTVIYERADETTRTEEFVTTLTIYQCLNPYPWERVRGYITHTAVNSLLEMSRE